MAIKAEIANWRWNGAPFYLRTGKRLRSRMSEIAVVFKDAPHSIFSEGAGSTRPNVLAIRLQPDEGIKLRLTIKEPGPGGMRLCEAPLDMTFAETLGAQGLSMPDAYERLVMDVIRGDQTLFMRGDEVEAAWRWVDPIIAAAETAPRQPQPYDSYSSGPEDAPDADASGRPALARTSARDADRRGRGPRAHCAHLLAGEVAAVLEGAIRDAGGAALAVPGGTTPAAFLSALGGHALDWAAVAVTLTRRALRPPPIIRAPTGACSTGRCSPAQPAPLGSSLSTTGRRFRRSCRSKPVCWAWGRIWHTALALPRRRPPGRGALGGMRCAGPAGWRAPRRAGGAHPRSPRRC